MMLKFRVRSSGTAACLSALASVVDGEAHARDVAENAAENCGGVNHRGGAMRSTSALVVARAARLSAMCLSKEGRVVRWFRLRERTVNSSDEEALRVRFVLVTNCVNSN